MTLSDLFLRFLVNRGIEKKLCGRISENIIDTIYVPRVQMEMDVFSRVGISDYFLVLYGIYDWCRRNNIPTSIGRGSAGGCLVSYLLGITYVDPIQYELLFERFYNIGRMETKSLPDIDFDVSQEHRDRILNEYLIPVYGKEFVAPIGTFGKMQARAAVKNFARVLGIPLQDAEKISNSINEHRGKVESISDAMRQVGPDGLLTKNAIFLKEMEKRYPELFKWATIADSIEAIQTESVHAAGIVVSPEPIGNYVPLRWVASKKIACTSYDMYELEHTGAMKLDLLGSRTLDVIQNTLIRAGAPKYHDFIEQVDFNDSKTWDLLKNGNTIGVFQLESNFMRTLLKNAKPNNIEDLSIINALGRPGPLDAKLNLSTEDINYIDGEMPPYIKKRVKNIDGNLSMNMIEVYTARHNGELKTTYLHPKLEPILNKTHGVFVFQENVMKAASDLSGFTLSESDVLRKIMGKKLVDKMPEQQERFIAGCKRNDIDEDSAQKIWQQMATFAEYGFNKCLAKGTKIFTLEKGFIPIENLWIGMHVLSVSKRNKLVFRKVLNVKSFGKKPCVKISTSHGGRHICTREHRIMTLRGLQSADKVKEGDTVFAPNFLPCPANINDGFSDAVDMASAMVLGYLINTDVKRTGSDFKMKMRRTGFQQHFQQIASTGAIHHLEMDSNRLYFTFDKPLGRSSVFSRMRRDRRLSLDNMNLGEIIHFMAGLFSSSANFYQNRMEIPIPNYACGFQVKSALLRLGISCCLRHVKHYDNKNNEDFAHVFYIFGMQNIERFEKYILPHTNDNFKQEFSKNRPNIISQPKIQKDALIAERIMSIEDCGEKRVYDIEVYGDTDEDHVYFADGLLTHNSHSVAYSALSYITAYLKTNYSAEFMASLISSDKDINKRSVWINDAKETMRLKIIPPDINLSDVDFIAKNNEIIFGLKEIKGMGSVAVNSILSERRNGKFKSLRDFYNRIDMNAVNVSKMAALIQTGALTTLHSNRAELLEWDAIIRERLFALRSKINLRETNISTFKNNIEEVKSMTELQIVNKFGNKVQQRQLSEGKKSVSEISQKIIEKMNQSLQKNIKEMEELENIDLFENLPHLPDMTLSQIIQKEADLLGIQISGTIASPFSNEISMYSQCTVGDLFDEDYVASEYGETLCGVFSNIKPTIVKTGKNCGKEMAICDFIDLTGKIRCMIIAKVFEKIKGVLMENKPFVVRGKLNDDKECLVAFEVGEC